MKYRETMSAVQAPDVYDGPNCNRHRPQWVGSADGEIGQTLKLSARTFPPGTQVVVSEPCCPHCDEVPSWYPRKGWRCGCDFDWKAFAEDEFS